MPETCDASNRPPPSIAICFFGITRSLNHTFCSIDKNVLSAASKHGRIKIYSHFFLQEYISNPRSGEAGSYDIDEYKLLDSDWIELEAPDACLSLWNFHEICEFGDFWGDDFRSTRNLVHQLHSLRQVTLAVERDAMEMCIFCRPDLIYHHRFGAIVSKALSQRGDHVWLPYWESWNGYNDRFAICKGSNAIRAYGRRIELMNKFCRKMGPLHAEKLVKFSLTENRIDTRFTGLRASRVRLDGVVKEEDFEHPRMKALRRTIGPKRIKKTLLGLLRK